MYLICTFLHSHIQQFFGDKYYGENEEEKPQFDDDDDLAGSIVSLYTFLLFFFFEKHFFYSALASQKYNITVFTVKQQINDDYVRVRTYFKNI